MKKKGFTLIELIAVIIILAIITLIATPIILNVVADAKKSAGQSEANMILTGITNYCEQEKIGVAKTNYCKDSETIILNFDKIINKGEFQLLDLYYYDGKVTWLKLGKNGDFYTLKNNKMIFDNSDRPNVPNAPKLFNNMVPIKYDGINWIIVNENSEWFDYEKKEWANAVVLNKNVTNKTIGSTITEDEIDLWYVWIPRFKYKLFDANNKNTEIQIKFELGNSNTGNIKCYKENEFSKEICKNYNENDNWYTHPAFKFGDKELEGFWVGKFEISGIYDIKNKEKEKITIKPNVSSLRTTNIANYSRMINDMNKFDKYNINADSHMMKNIEWGAVAYLSQSRYGKCDNGTCKKIRNNNNSDYKTGFAAVDENVNNDGTNIEVTQPYNTNVGVTASTTQNIYGIYDMSGGAWEYVLSGIIDANNKFIASNSGLTEYLPEKYHEKYKPGEARLGDATLETKNWDNGASLFPDETWTWFCRGGMYQRGYNSGIFNYDRDRGNGNRFSTRAVLS